MRCCLHIVVNVVIWWYSPLGDPLGLMCIGNVSAEGIQFYIDCMGSREPFERISLIHLFGQKPSSFGLLCLQRWRNLERLVHLVSPVSVMGWCLDYITGEQTIHFWQAGEWQSVHLRPSYFTLRSKVSAFLPTRVNMSNLNKHLNKVQMRDFVLRGIIQSCRMLSVFSLNRKRTCSKLNWGTQESFW